MIYPTLIQPEYAAVPYMDRQPDINKKMRAILVDWLVEVHLRFKLEPLTLWLTVNILDRYLMREQVLRAKLQLVGISSLLIACKYEEIFPPAVSDCVSITDKAYNNYNSLGFRPMPGITGFRISSQNTYGTIRIAEIDFTVWTVEDLEIAEKIYLKPGYSMLVEWGHTVFINNSGEIRRAGNELYTIPDKEWFKLGQKSSKILELIDTKRRNSSYNYDAFWGYCSNFSYSFRPDGGYNCSIKIISAGQVIESIKAGNTEATGKPKEKDADEDLLKQKSPFHLIFRTLDEYTKADDGDVDFQGNVLDRLKEKIEFKVKGFEPFSCFMHELTLLEESANPSGLN